MPLWLQILCIVLALGFLVVLIDLIFTLVSIAFTVRDNIVFDNKYKRKIYNLKEKLKKYNDKINDKIDYLNYKSIYCENMKILHEKNLDDTILMNTKVFMKYENNRKKNKKK